MNEVRLEQSGIGGFLQRATVLIPALNEAPCIASTVAAWLKLGVRAVRVVDNNSTDGTAAAARAAGAEVVLEPQRGYGAAAWRGLHNWPAEIDWVIFSSADGSDRISVSELSAWQNAVESGADLVIGDRVSLKESRRELKWTQRAGNRLVCEAIRVGWKAQFKEMGSLRVVRHDALMGLELVDRGFGWNVEMQVRAIERGWRIVELPVRYYPRTAGASKISGSMGGTLRAGKSMLRMLAFLWMLRRQNRAATSRDVSPTASPGS